MNIAYAHEIIKAAVAEAVLKGDKMNVAVVDKAGQLVAFERMDGAWRGSIDIAIMKAKTSALFTMNTEILGELSQPGGALYGIEHSNDGLITFGGGIPIHDEFNEVIGAVGVSGGTVTADQLIAEAGISV